MATIAALAATGGSALAATPHASSGVKNFTETEAGTQLSTDGLRFEDAFKIKGGTFGYGTAIRDGAFTGDTFPASAKDTAGSFYRDGRLSTNETLSYAPPRVNGVGSITGTGTCIGGTEAHQGETCTYKIKGNYDLITGRVYLTLSGTYTLSSTATKKKK